MTTTAEASLPAWASRAIDELHQADVRARAVTAGLSVEQIYWRPAPGSWSIGECLQHLVQSNDVYLAAIGRALEGRSPAPVEAITPGWFGRWFIRVAIEPSDRTRRNRAPRSIMPPATIDRAILGTFLRSNDAARGFVRRASRYDVNRIRFVNPFVSLVRFTAGTGIEIVWRHQRRHLLQAERVAASSEFPRH
jgi:hypothetical protein